MSNLEKLTDELSKLTLLEAADLVKMLEDKWDVKASVGGLIASPLKSDSEEVKVEKTEFDLELTEIGPKKIPVIKVVRELTGLGLREAKSMVDEAPKIVKSSISKADAEAMKIKLEEQGAKVTIK